MGNENLTIEEKVDRLFEQLESLARRVADLEGSKAASTAGKSVDASVAPSKRDVPQAGPPQTGKPQSLPAAGEPDSFSEEMIQWARRASLFPRLATLCFLMVFALVLRTITDSGIVNTLLGMGLGMGYAAALMVAGWYLYRRESPLAPVFSLKAAWASCFSRASSNLISIP